MVTDQDGGAAEVGMSANSAFEAARLRKRLGLRTVEKLTAELEQQNPELYERITKTTIWELESQDTAIINSRKFSPNKLRAYIKVVFDGDYARFKEETGFTAPLLEPATTDGTSETSVPWYIEYETPRVREWPRFAAPLLPASQVDFVYVAKSLRMSPVLPTDQLAHCRYTTDPMIRSLAIVRRAAYGLQAAWRLDETRYAYELPEQGEAQVFQLGPDDSAFGMVTWIQPVLDGSAARFGRSL